MITSSNSNRDPTQSTLPTSQPHEAPHGRRRPPSVRRPSTAESMVHRALSQLNEAVTEDVAMFGKQVAPAPGSSPSSVIRGTLSKSWTFTANDLAIVLTESKTALFRHNVASFLEGVLGAILSSLLLLAVYFLLECLVSTFHVDRSFFYIASVCANLEVVMAVSVGRKSKA